MKVFQARGENEVFAVSQEQFNDEKKHWVENPTTFVKLKVKYGFDWKDIDQDISLTELNQYLTGDTILWDADKKEFVVGKRAKDIYFPTPPFPTPPPLKRELFFGRMTVDQTIQGPDGENLLINVADVDTLNGFNAGANRYVIQHSGYFSLIAQMWIDGGVELGGYQVFIRINGAARNSHPCTHKDNWMGGWDWWRATGTGGDLSPRAIWTPKHLNKNNYVQAYAWGRPYSYKVQGTEPYCGHKTYLSVVELMRD